jgi:hypothetical protein
MPRRGLEPLILSEPDPKSGASANFATSALGGHSLPQFSKMPISGGLEARRTQVLGFEFSVLSLEFRVAVGRSAGSPRSAFGVRRSAFGVQRSLVAIDALGSSGYL